MAGRHIRRAFEKSGICYETWKVGELDGVAVIGVLVNDGDIFEHGPSLWEGELTTPAPKGSNVARLL
jgi:hypothetical protein